jgi:putative MATE family efflux protein
MPSSNLSKTASMPLVEGNLWNAIWIMSWPLLLTTLAGSTVGIVDVQVAGMLGPSVQAAVGLSEQIIFIFSIFALSIGVGTTAIVSRAYGEENTEKASFACAQSLLLSVLSGIALSILSLFFAKFMLPLFSRSPDVINQGAFYLGVYGIYLIPFSVICISNASFRAIGNAKIPLLVISLEVIINVLGDYLTIVYNWPIPNLGVRGIAYSAIFGATLGAILSIYQIYKSSLKDSLKKLWPASLSELNRILNIGLPAAMQRLSWAASTLVLFFILAKLENSTAALASWTIGIRVEALLFMPLMALSLAVASIVGQNIGANQTDRAFKAGWRVTYIGIWLMIILSTLLFFGAKSIASFMSHDPKTIEYTMTYLQINAFSEPFFALNTILSGGLQGAGDTKLPMWVSLFSNWIVRLPLAWLLALVMNLGPNGVWLAMLSSTIISAIIIVIRYQSKTWLTIKV